MTSPLVCWPSIWEEIHSYVYLILQEYVEEFVSSFQKGCFLVGRTEWNTHICLFNSPRMICWRYLSPRKNLFQALKKAASVLDVWSGIYMKRSYENIVHIQDGKIGMTLSCTEKHLVSFSTNLVIFNCGLPTIHLDRTRSRFFMTSGLWFRRTTKANLLRWRGMVCLTTFLAPSFL